MPQPHTAHLDADSVPNASHSTPCALISPSFILRYGPSSSVGTAWWRRWRSLPVRLHRYLPRRTTRRAITATPPLRWSAAPVRSVMRLVRPALLHVGPVLEVLEEVADVAADLVPGLKGEGYYRDEAEREPFPA